MKYRTGSACHVRLDLVRQVGHPGRQETRAYELVVPLNVDGHIDATSWLDDPTACSVHRIDRGVDEWGVLARTPSGRWYFDFHTGHDADDHCGIVHGDANFHRGAMLRINERDGTSRTFRVTSIEPAKAEA